MRRDRSPSEELVLERVLKVVCMVLRGEETILYLKELV